MPKIRCMGSGHSWTHLFGDDGSWMLDTSGLNEIVWSADNPKQVRQGCYAHLDCLTVRVPVHACFDRPLKSNEAWISYIDGIDGVRRMRHQFLARANTRNRQQCKEVWRETLPGDSCATNRSRSMLRGALSRQSVSVVRPGV